jgi:hypothetical protein
MVVTQRPPPMMEHFFLSLSVLGMMSLRRLPDKPQPWASQLFRMSRGPWGPVQKQRLP